jgi:hypothetical protein
MMRKIILAAALAVASFSAAQAGGFGVGAGGVFGGSSNWSGASNFAGSVQFGNAAAGAGTQSYGQSEATFHGGYSAGFPATGFGLNGTVTSATGSQSNASSAAAGNGFGAAATGGFGSAGGVSGGIGGAVKLP